MHRHLSWMALVISVGCGVTAQSGNVAPVRLVPLARIVRLQVEYASGRAADPAALAIWPGAEDEAADGPASFEVLADGTLVVADPLARRIAFFAADGRFSRAVLLPYVPDRIALDGQRLLARDASTERWLAPDASGAYTVVVRPSWATVVRARLTALNRGFVPGPEGGETGGLSVVWQHPSARLVSIERLGAEPDGTTFVALEATSGSLSDVLKVVRKYRPDGRADLEVRDIPLEYYITPRDELRVRGGWLYQLEPLDTEVRINAWPLSNTSAGKQQ